MSNNKLDILNFKGDFDRAIYLQHKLNERVFRLDKRQKLEHTLKEKQLC